MTFNQQVESFEQHLQPWQRGLLLISLTSFLLISLYLLTKKEKPSPRELTELEKKHLEKLAEERLIQRMVFLKKLKE